MRMSSMALAAVAGGRSCRGEIAQLLDALVSARLVEPTADAARQKRTSFQLAEPMVPVPV